MLVFPALGNQMTYCLTKYKSNAQFLMSHKSPCGVSTGFSYRSVHPKKLVPALSCSHWFDMVVNENPQPRDPAVSMGRTGSTVSLWVQVSHRVRNAGA